MLFFVPAGAFAVLYLASRRTETRRLRNGVFLTAAAGCALLGAVTALTRFVPALSSVVNAAALAVLALVVALAVALIANGVTMLRLEGRSLGNLLSLLAGVAVLVVPTGSVLLAAGAVLSPLPPVVVIVAAAAGALLFLGCVYVALTFTAFAVYSLVYGRCRPPTTPSAIVVLGSGLVHGDVPPLLRSRLDKALDLYRAVPADAPRPVLIPSGGQGRDEPRPEADAMAEYLVAQGADPADVLPERTSTNTRENISFSRRVSDDAGRSDRPVIVTNNYHVLRAAVTARSLGSPAHVVGSRTATYYVPSAFLREYVAVMVQHRRLNLASAGAATLFVATLGAYAAWA